LRRRRRWWRRRRWGRRGHGTSSSSLLPGLAQRVVPSGLGHELVEPREVDLEGYDGRGGGLGGGGRRGAADDKDRHPNDERGVRVA